jgi:aldehyde dehydrogenase (NAD+)
VGPDCPNYIGSLSEVDTSPQGDKTPKPRQSPVLHWPDNVTSLRQKDTLVYVREQLLIGGEWVQPTNSEPIEVRSPTTEEFVGHAAAASAADMDRAVIAARNSFDSGVWRERAGAERADVLEHVAKLIDSRSDELATLITSEMGAPKAAVVNGQIPTANAVLRYYAQLARDFDFEEKRTNGRATSLVAHEPVGVVAAIIPWNAPLLLSVLKLAPALAAGCSVVLKPAPQTPLDGYLLGELFIEAGLPAGTLSILAAGASAGEHLVTHPGVDKVTFTGSTAAGQRIAALCGAQLKRVSLELGGKSAAILLDDAPLDKAIPRLVPLAFENSGQACTAQTRILVSRARHDAVVDALAEAVRGLKVGDPFDSATDLGPLVSEVQRQRVEGYIASGSEQGGRVVVGGGRPTEFERGWYVEPTIFVDVRNDMRIAQEEIFGPVVTVIAYDDVDQAVSIANDSKYGLAGSVWTADAELGLSIARRVRTGSSRVNGAGHILETPAGGFKQSGIGREFGPEGLQLYLEDKAIAVRLPTPR